MLLDMDQFLSCGAINHHQVITYVKEFFTNLEDGVACIIAHNKSFCQAQCPCFNRETHRYISFVSNNLSRSEKKRFQNDTCERTGRFGPTGSRVKIGEHHDHRALLRLITHEALEARYCAVMADKPNNFIDPKPVLDRGRRSPRHNPGH